MKKANDRPLTKLANAAFEQAAQRVIERARQSGTPVIVWEDEAVKDVEPRKTQKPLKDKEASGSLDWSPFRLMRVFHGGRSLWKSSSANCSIYVDHVMEVHSRAPLLGVYLPDEIFEHGKPFRERLGDEEFFEQL